MSSKVLDIDLRLRLPGFSLEVAQELSLDGCTAVFGPSGSGKSTLLRLLAGFAKPQEGLIRIGDEVWCDTDKGIFMPAYKRRVGILFQDARLFPHMTVEGNLAYADKRARAVPTRFSLKDIVGAFDLAPLLSRLPDRLSGGEQQRVGLARTLLTRPDLLLLDEPLSALDRRRKSEIIPYLDDLPRQFGIPAIYVSHDVEEIVRLADQVMVLKAGALEAYGPTAEIMNAVGATRETEKYGPGVVLEGKVESHDEEFLLTRVQLGSGLISLPINRRKVVGETVAIRIDARNVAIATAAPVSISIRNVLPAIIADIIAPPDSTFVEIVLQVSGATLRAQVTKAAVDELSLTNDREVYALIKSASFDL